MLQQVYVLESVSGLVKIGITNKLKRRIREIETASGYKIVSQWSTKQSDLAREIEQAVHKILKDCREQGEWFSVDFAEAAELTSYISSQISGFPFDSSIRPYSGIKKYHYHLGKIEIEKIPITKFPLEKYKISFFNWYLMVGTSFTSGVVGVTLLYVVISNYGHSKASTSLIISIFSLFLLYISVFQIPNARKDNSKLIKNEMIKHKKKEEGKLMSPISCVDIRLVNYNKNKYLYIAKEKFEGVLIN